MMYGWHDGAWGFVWMILSWGVIVGLVWAAVRAFSRDERGPSRDPKDVLGERFARGEIDAEEYHERLRVLEDARAHTSSK